MIKLNDYFHLDKQATKGSMSLSGKLEAIVGNYFVSGEGNPDETIYTIYYDPTIDSYYDSVELVDKNLIGYVTSDYDAFEKIDSGMKYLNPDHFSVKELIRAIH